MMRTLLVTGGAGFIGGNYVLRSLARDPALRIVNLDLLTYAGNLDTLQPRTAMSVTCSQGDTRTMRWPGCSRPTVPSGQFRRREPRRSFHRRSGGQQTNVVGTLNLLQCKGWIAENAAGRRATPSVFLTFTDEVYGSPGETGSFSESTPYAPTCRTPRPTGSDHLVCAFHHTTACRFTTNCSNNYGPTSSRKSSSR
jgi:dTDP-glucose 4,6-dehydratase